KSAWQTASKVVLVGAGWIGLEVAAAARAAGLDVTVLESAELPLLNVLGRENAAVFADLHRAHDVDLRLGTHITEITGADPNRATGVRLGDGEVVSGDLVVVGVGVEPNIDLARAAGLITDNGIRVEADLRSSNHDIYAAGDAANAFHPLLGKHIRVEHWANALNQPAVAVKSMLGMDAVYERLPYFYSDQYELGMEYTGYVTPGGYDDVVFRGDSSALEYVTFWLKDGLVLAGMNVNVWDVTTDVGALVRSGRPVDRALLADPSVPLAEVLAAADPEA
ncbi:MAG: FAD/NAD(P)-binding oxidoreductase, partial [Actinomycetes bacterium]